MKRFFVFLFVLIIGVVSPAYALECDYAVEPQFSYGRTFVNGIALVSKNGETAVIDQNGKLVIGFDQRVKRVRSNGLIMIVGDNDLGAFFDKSGNQLTEYVYDTYPTVDPKQNIKTYNLREDDGDGKSDLVPFSRGNRYGFINPYGTEVIAPIYEYAYGFKNGIAVICSEGVLSDYGTYTNGKYGFIKETGEVILTADSYWIAASNYDGGYFTAANGETYDVLIDRQGTVATADEIGYGKIDADNITVKDADGNIGVVDRDRNVVVPMGVYSNISYWNDEYFILDYKTVVNRHNEVVYQAEESVTVAPLYLNIYDKSRFARLTKKDHPMASTALYGLLNTQGEVIMEVQYDSLYDLGEGLIYAREGNKNSLYDYNGAFLCEISGNNCGQCVNGLFAVTDTETATVGYMVNPIQHPKIFIDGEKITSDVLPKIENGRTLVPMRAIFEAMDAEILWDGSTGTVTAIKDENTITLRIGETVLYKNGVPVSIDVPAKIENNRTLVPIRAVSESLECTVNWEPFDRIVTITSKSE